MAQPTNTRSQTAPWLAALAVCSMASVIYIRLRPAFDGQASSARDVHEVHSIGTRSQMI